MELTYFIADIPFDIANEKGVLVDIDGNYYSDKVITNGSKVNIQIGNDGYEIIYE